jgi:sodium transport system ATP-binding protein
MLRAEHLRKEFFPPRGEPIVAVADASFEVGPGEVFGLLGPNGAGKTTLLRMLAAIIAPTSGLCLVDGMNAREHPDAVRRSIGFLSGNTRIYGRLTAKEVLRYFGRLYGLDDATIATRTGALAAQLGMADFMDRRCEALSTGQSQKVSIARVMLHEPKVLILDEPSLGLDIMTSRAIVEFIVRARERGHSIIFSTHYMTEAERLCDRIAFIHRGEIMCIDTLAGICAATATRDLQEAFIAMAERHGAAA